jgi:C4-dicarboxylate-specific signal transduction histidine kinase
MSTMPDDIGRQQLRYFSQVSASISHELKNVLAILNEHAGLLQDYAALAEQGQPLDVQRIRSLSDTMQAQIGRGDAIVKRMNRFAHSADQSRASVEVDQLARLVCELFARTAATRGVTVEVKTAEGDRSLTTDPCSLETLLGSLLDRLTAALPAGSTLSIELSGPADAVQISLAGAAQRVGAAAEVLEEEDIRALLAVLQASMELNEAGDSLILTLPGTIDA